MAALYDLPSAPSALAERAESDAVLMRRRLGRTPVVGDRVRLGSIDLIVRDVEANRIGPIGVMVEPKASPLEGSGFGRGLTRLIARIGRRSG